MILQNCSFVQKELRLAATGFPPKYYKMLGPSPKKGLLKLLLNSRRILDLWGTIPYRWQNQSRKFIVKPSKALKRLRWCWYMVILYTLFTGIQIYCILERLTVPLFIQCMFYFIFDCIGVFTIHDQMKYSKETVSLLNGMMTFETRRCRCSASSHKLIQPNLDVQKRMCVIIAKLLTYCATMLTITGQISFIRQPCIPIQPGFFLVNQCNKPSSKLIPSNSILRQLSLSFLSENFVVLTLSTFAFASRTCMLNAIMTQMAIGIIIKPLCIYSYIKATVELYQKKNTSLGYVIYKEIEVIVKYYNNVYKRGTIGSLLYIIIMGTISMYACVNLGKVFSLEKRLIYSYTAMCMFFCGIQMYGLLGAIYEESSNLVKLFQKGRILDKTNSRKYNNRMIRSYAPFKIHLGDVNFVDMSTPLVSQDFIIQRTVDLSLLT